jgi:hypothetical protein
MSLHLHLHLHLGLCRSVAKGFPPLPPALMANVVRNMPSALGGAGAGAGAPTATGIDFSIYGGKSASDAAEAEAGAEGSGLVSRRLWYYVLQKQGIFTPSSRAVSASASASASRGAQGGTGTTKAVGMEMGMDMGMEAAEVGPAVGTAAAAAATVAPPPASVLWQHVSNHQIAQMARGLLRGAHTVQGKRELGKGLGRGA